jgi:hypothetical protein
VDLRDVVLFVSVAAVAITISIFIADKISRR